MLQICVTQVTAVLTRLTPDLHRVGVPLVGTRAHELIGGQIDMATVALDCGAGAWYDRPLARRVCDGAIGNVYLGTALSYECSSFNRSN